jgi:transcriptional regulator with XRE-family HTH domain
MEFMDIGERLRLLREAKNLSQGDIEQRTGLLRCYISRVENGHTIPAVKTLEKMAQALEVQLHELLYDGDRPPELVAPITRTGDAEKDWGTFGKEGRFFRKLQRYLARMDVRQRDALISFAEKLTQ